MYTIIAIPLPHSRPHSHPATHHIPHACRAHPLCCAPHISRCAPHISRCASPYLSLRITIVPSAVPIRSACHALHSTYCANHPAERTSLILFPRFIFTNLGHDIIIANTDIHISRPDFPTKQLSTSPETREKTKKVAITCEKGTFQLPFRTLSPLFRPFQSLSNISFISSFTVIWSL